MRRVMMIHLFLTGLLLSQVAYGCDWTTGERQQKVYVSWDHQAVANWTVKPGELNSISLPNDFQLGLKLEAPEPQKISEYREKIPYPPEMVSISLNDLGDDAPVFLTRTYDVTNSIQGYGARGGADRVDALGDPGVH